MTTYDLFDDSPAPKRGDLVRTNVGDRRERTWMILSSRRVKRDSLVRRFKLWMVRWWELEPEQRIALFRSAERAGGQQVYMFYRYKRAKKPTFEQYMRRSV